MCKKRNAVSGLRSAYHDNLYRMHDFRLVDASIVTSFYSAIAGNPDTRLHTFIALGLRPIAINAVKSRMRPFAHHYPYCL